MPTRTLVDGYTFLVSPETDAQGIQPGDTGGLFHRDTRYLSALTARVGDSGLSVLDSTLDSPRQRTTLLAPSATAVNSMAEGGTVPKHTDWHLRRRVRVSEGMGCRQTLTLANHAPEKRTFELTVGFDTDFADLFEVRGLESGIDRAIAHSREDRTVRKQYRVSGTETSYTTTIGFESAPETLTDTEASFELAVQPGETGSVTTTVALGEALPPTWAWDDDREPVAFPALTAEDDTFDGVLKQAAADLAALTTETEHGPVALAGTPWFVTPFGRDSLIAAYQALPFAPGLATGTLRYLAAHQGIETDAYREAEPGKVFHEQRFGELAIRGHIPHAPYYGTIDATPLWVLLLAETVAWQGSTELAVELADSLQAALAWIRDTAADGPDDPFLYYDASEAALEHKGWKDTGASIRSADGSKPDWPLAVAEVQGYAAAALSAGSDLLEQVDAGAPLDAYRALAGDIRSAFDESFWLPERSFYALALSGDGTVVDSLTSNIGHCLWTGLVPDARADAVVETLSADGLSGGWGVRTMSADDAGYSPISYHAGGVWPHDTSLVALGLANYGYGDFVDRLASQVLTAGTSFRNERLPELYCGFSREAAPVTYPAACVPQAWSAGAPFALARASFGLEPGETVPKMTRVSSVFSDSALASVSRIWGGLERSAD